MLKLIAAKLSRFMSLTRGRLFRLSSLCVVLLAMLLPAMACADNFGPGVFEQLQQGTLSPTLGKITSLEVGDKGIAIGVTTKTGRKTTTTTTTRFCDDFSGSEAESFRSAQTVARLELLREAFRSGENVELAFAGPWSPCLRSIRLIKKKS